jgi:hypothetical protein
MDGFKSNMNELLCFFELFYCEIKLMLNAKVFYFLIFSSSILLLTLFIFFFIFKIIILFIKVKYSFLNNKKKIELLKLNNNLQYKSLERNFIKLLQNKFFGSRSFKFYKILKKHQTETAFIKILLVRLPNLCIKFIFCIKDFY